MSDPFIGEIQAFPFSFAAQGFGNGAWMPCSGQLLPVRSNTSLYSLIGNTYGGNGTTTFALPNLNGAVVIGMGGGPGLPTYTIGETAGSPTVGLIPEQMTTHNHTLQLGVAATANPAPGPGAGGDMLAIDPAFNGFVAPPGNVTLAANAVGLTGQGLPHDNMQPNQALIWCIAVAGIFPIFGSS